MSWRRNKWCNNLFCKDTSGNKEGFVCCLKAYGLNFAYIFSTKKVLVDKPIFEKLMTFKEKKTINPYPLYSYDSKSNCWWHVIFCEIKWFI